MGSGILTPSPAVGSSYRIAASSPQRPVVRRSGDVVRPPSARLHPDALVGEARPHATHMSTALSRNWKHRHDRHSRRGTGEVLDLEKENTDGLTFRHWRAGKFASQRSGGDHATKHFTGELDYDSGICVDHVSRRVFISPSQIPVYPEGYTVMCCAPGLCPALNRSEGRDVTPWPSHGRVLDDATAPLMSERRFRIVCMAG